MIELDWLDGLIRLPWWGYVLVVLGLTHVTIVAVTVFLHRSQAHRALDLHPAVAHFFRFWLWLTTGMVTREWVAIHRKHHARCETEEDPHSPQVKGIGKVLWEGAELYREAAADRELVARYGRGTPEDWVERRLYTRWRNLGITLMLVIDLVAFGVLGLSIWAVQMIWIPLFAAGVINGLGHWWGYRNFESPDAATNIVPWGLLIGGEELHNNHHAYPSSAKLSSRWWEIDLGWGYIRLLSLFGLARVRRVAPVPVIDATKQQIDMDTLRAVIAARLHVMSAYARTVMMPALQEQLRRADSGSRALLAQVARVWTRSEERLDDTTRRRLLEAVSRNEVLRTVYEFRQRLQAVWTQSVNNERLLQALQDWCKEAEATGVESLQRFARQLRGFALTPA